MASAGRRTGERPMTGFAPARIPAGSRTGRAAHPEFGYGRVAAGAAERKRSRLKRRTAAPSGNFSG